MEKRMQYKMTKETGYQALLLTLSLCVCLLSYQLYVSSAEKVSPAAAFLQLEQETNTAPAAASAPRYFVFAHNGVVTARDCRDDHGSILLKNIDPRIMREGDRKRFESGFFLYSEEEFQELLEDYSS